MNSSWSSELEAQIQSLPLIGQSIEIETFHMTFAECELCVSAYTHSLKTHMSNVVSDGILITVTFPRYALVVQRYLYSQIGLKSELRHYLDATEMHDWLEHYDENYWGIKANSAGI
jgi:hypothetical protein